MFFRIALLFVTLFWLTMNYLLWRSEYGGREHLGSVVPVELVWRKILTAPDTSSLEIFHHGQKAGFCRWSASIGQEGGRHRAQRDDSVPEGMIVNPAGYRLDFEANLTLKDVRPGVLLNLGVKLDSNREWQEFEGRMVMAHDAVSIRSVAAQTNITIRMENGATPFERTLTFADLQNPQALAKAFDIPLPLELLGLSEMPFNSGKLLSLSPGLQWEARNDRIIVGHNTIRAYRLRARLLDHYEIVILVSPVGEILRVELPDDWVLIYDQMGAM